MEKIVKKKSIKELGERLGELQRVCREKKIPVMIAFEGYGAAGKGFQIGNLIQALDPRGFEVYAVKNETEEEKMHPFMWRFWTKIPEKGRIAIFDTSWYRRVMIDRFEGKTPEKELENDFASIRAFEKQLTDDGMVLIKLFLKIDKKEQKKRFEKLLESPDTAWRVSKGDLKRNKEFKKYKAINEEMLRKTDADYAPWIVIDATKKKAAESAIYQAVIQALEEAVARKEEEEKNSLQKKMEADKEKAASNADGQMEVKKKNKEESILAKADLSKAMTKEVYEERLKELQKKMEHLHGELYRRRIPVVLGFEGWDAGGKGGAIKRLTAHMDPRGYVVNPTASPSDTEKAHHYLWRFWRAMPKAGHIAIFDRTWYGRVMVERIEGFCTENEWKRAYGEINAMEQDLVNAGAVVLKFWMQIDKDEQARRFKARQENPKKQWKITDEDWRNREKWDQYEVAVEEMLKKTSTPQAPWIVVEGNDKYYARIKVLECVTEAIEKRLKEEKKGRTV